MRISPANSVNGEDDLEKAGAAGGALEAAAAAAELVAAKGGEEEEGAEEASAGSLSSSSDEAGEEEEATAEEAGTWSCGASGAEQGAVLRRAIAAAMSNAILSVRAERVASGVSGVRA